MRQLMMFLLLGTGLFATEKPPSSSWGDIQLLRNASRFAMSFDYDSCSCHAFEMTWDRRLQSYMVSVRVGLAHTVPGVSGFDSFDVVAFKGNVSLKEWDSSTVVYSKDAQYMGRGMYVAKVPVKWNGETSFQMQIYSSSRNSFVIENEIQSIFPNKIFGSCKDQKPSHCFVGKPDFYNPQEWCHYTDTGHAFSLTCPKPQGTSCHYLQCAFYWNEELEPLITEYPNLINPEDNQIKTISCSSSIKIPKESSPQLLPDCTSGTVDLFWNDNRPQALNCRLDPAMMSFQNFFEKFKTLNMTIIGDSTSWQFVNWGLCNKSPGFKRGREYELCQGNSDKFVYQDCDSCKNPDTNQVLTWRFHDQPYLFPEPIPRNSETIGEFLDQEPAGNVVTVSMGFHYLASVPLKLVKKQIKAVVKSMARNQKRGLIVLWKSQFPRTNRWDIPFQIPARSFQLESYAREQCQAYGVPYLSVWNLITSKLYLQAEVHPHWPAVEGQCFATLAYVSALIEEKNKNPTFP